MEVIIKNTFLQQGGTYVGLLPKKRNKKKRKVLKLNALQILNCGFSRTRTFEITINQNKPKNPINKGFTNTLYLIKLKEIKKN